MHHLVLSEILLGLAVLLAILAATGMAVMRDTFQRLHFSAIVVSFSMLFIAVAVWIEENDPQARIKVALTGLILFVMNAILTHATAKAVRIRRAGHWEVRNDEGIHLVGRAGVAGPGKRDEDRRA